MKPRDLPARKNLFEARVEKFAQLSALGAPSLTHRQAVMIVDAYHGGRLRALAWLLADYLKDQRSRVMFWFGHQFHRLGVHDRIGPDGQCLGCRGDGDVP